VKKRARQVARLCLRALEKGDRALFCELYTDAETMRYIGPAMSADTALASFRATLRARRRRHGPRFFVVVERYGKRALGLCSIQAIASDAPLAELGIMLEPGARRRRLGRETMAWLMAETFGTLSVDTVWVQYRSANVAAARLFAGLGFVSRRGARPYSAKPTQCVRFMHRSAWQAMSNQSSGG
jgi:RimJ/RimL family protein N-acetyltransferase